MEKDLIKIVKSSFGSIKPKQLDLLRKNKFQITDLDKFDSLNYLKFITKVEKKFKIKVNEKNFNKFNNFRMILDLLKKKYKD